MRCGGKAGAAQSWMLRCVGIAVLRCGGKAGVAEKLVRRKAGAAEKLGAAVRRDFELRCGGNCGGRSWRGRHFDAAGAVIGGSGVWFASVRLLEPTPCKPVLRPGSAIDRHLSRQLRRDGRFGARKFRRANVCGGSRLKAGARSLSVSRGAGCFGGGAERAQLAELHSVCPVGERCAAGGRGAELLWGAAEAGRGGVAKLARWVKLQKGWRCRRGGTSREYRSGMTGRETGGAAQSWRIARSCFWGGGPGLGAKCPVLAGVTQSWRIARNCLKGFTPFRTSQDR